MKQILLFLLLTTSVRAADWTGAVWSTLYTRTGYQYMGVMRGLNCAGDTVFLTMVSGPNCAWYDLYRIVPEQAAEPIAPPFEGVVATMNYSSIERTGPALLDHNLATLWSWRENGWDSLQLREGTGESTRSPQCFVYDSTGALHTLWSEGAMFWDRAMYRRRGGGQPGRDSNLFPVVGWTYGFEMYNSLIMAPTAHSVVAIIPAYPDLEFGNGGFSVFASPGETGFTAHGFGIGCPSPSSMTCLDHAGRWMLGYGSGGSVYALTTRDTIWDTAGQSLLTDVTTAAFRIVVNPADSVFEAAALLHADPPNEVAFFTYDREQLSWNAESSLSPPFVPIGTMHFMIDQVGRGHLFLADSIHLWHYGPPIIDAVPAITAGLPGNFGLSVSPNPFNCTTRIKFTLPASGHVELTIFDVLGRKVANLENGRLEAGFHERVFDANFLPTGLYFVKLNIESQTRYGKLVLIK